jgi:hypothetical protein
MFSQIDELLPAMIQMRLPWPALTARRLSSLRADTLALQGDAVNTMLELLPSEL